ncbi:MAG: hypothetical protein QM702_10545 [Rubrivivax sp.]
MALFMARLPVADGIEKAREEEPSEVGAAERGPELAVHLGPTASEDAQVPFRTMRALVEKRDYSVAAWQRLLNDPLLDAPGANRAFEHALVSALSENELKTTYTLSAGKGWRDLVESRYAWVSDGLRYARQFPLHTDLRETLVELGRSSRPIPYSPVPEHANSAGRLGFIAFVIFVLLTLLKIFVHAPNVLGTQ